MSGSSIRAWFALVAAIFNIGLPIGFAMSIAYDFVKLQLIFLTLIPLCNSAVYICTSMIGGFALQPRMGGYIWFLACGVLFMVLTKEEGVRMCYPGLGILYLSTGLIGIGSLIYDLKANEEGGVKDDEKMIEMGSYVHELEKMNRDMEVVLNNDHGGSVWVQPGNDELVFDRRVRGEGEGEREGGGGAEEGGDEEAHGERGIEGGRERDKEEEKENERDQYDIGAVDGAKDLEQENTDSKPEGPLSEKPTAPPAAEEVTDFSERIKKLQSDNFAKNFDLMFDV